MKHVLLALTFFLAATVGRAQPTNTDSLLRVWGDSTAGYKERIMALVGAYQQDSSLSALKAAQLALPGMTDTTSRSFVRQHALATLARGDAFNDPSNYAERVILLGKALKDFKRSGDPQLEALVANVLGATFVELGQFSAAVPYQLQALQGFEALRDTAGIYGTLASIAYTYMQLDDVPRAQLTYLRCLRLAEGRDTQQEFNALIRLATNFNGSGDSTGQHAYLQRAEALVEQGRVVDDANEIGMNYAFKHLAEKDCERALERIEQGLKIHRSKPAPSPNWISFLLGLKARAHLCAHRYKEAIALSKEGLELATDHGLLKETLDNLRPLAEACEAVGDVRNALLYTRRYHALKDSAATSESASKLAGSLLTVDFEKQQFADSLATAAQRAQDKLVAAQEVKRQRTQRNVLLGFGAFGLLFAAVDYRRRRRIKAEHARSEALLLNILPAEVAEELKAKGSAEAVHIDQVSVLFTDFKGFTAMSETLSPQELVRDLNECFSAFDHITAKHGIEKIKTIGDAYMAAGGLPTPNTTHATDVIRAAFEMRDFIAEGKARKITAGRPYFEIRIGIHTGPVVAGIVGVKKFQYDIWGDTVNTASRMESSGEVGQVNISEATYALVKDVTEADVPSTLRVDLLRTNDTTGQHATNPAFHFTPRGKVQAKGKGEMEMYFVHQR